MMKNNYVTKLTLLVFTLLCSVLSWGQATLPTSFSGSLWNTGLPAGWSQTGFGADYGSNYDAIGGNAGKMDNTGDVLVINFTGTANTLSYYLGGNSLSGSYIFDVLESADGVSYTTVRSHTSLSNQIIAAPGTSWTSSLLATTRYVKFIYTTKATGNVGIDGVNISFVSTNTITTNTALVGSPFCVTSSTGAAVSVPFTSVGTFNAGNVYTAQLSNAAGSFASPVSIGTVTSTLNTDIISATIPAGTAAGVGYRIRVVANNPVVTGIDNTINLIVQNSAAITAQPSTTVQNICQSGSATALSVTATGTTVTYQWYSNVSNSNSGGTLISGATSASYTPSTAAVGTLYYYCVVTAACGSAVTSNVSGAVNVTSVPSAPAGTINVSANPSCGIATLSYSAPSTNIYWQTIANGVLTGSPTTTNYLSSATAGTYTVYVRELIGSCWSPAISVTFTVVATVAITAQPPLNKNITDGGNTTFTVTATGTTPSYQWQVDTTGTGTSFVDLTNGAPYSTVTTATLNITAAPITMNGYLYRCVVSGAAPCGPVTSNSGSLTVTLTAPNNPTNIMPCYGNNTLGLTWTASSTGATPAPDGYMVFALAGSTAPASTSAAAGNSSLYTANSDFSLAATVTPSLGKCLYKGTGTSFTVTGLANLSNYSFKVVAYRGTTGTAWSSGITATPTGTWGTPTTNITIDMPEVTALAASVASGQSALTWANVTNPSVCNYEYLIVANQGPVVFTPSGDGTAYSANVVYSTSNQVVYKGTGTGITVTGLTNGTNYCYKVFVRRGTEWSDGVSVCQIPNLVYCASGATNAIDSEIENVTLVGYSTTISNNTANTCTTGVNNYTALSADLQVAGTYTVSVEFGDCNGGAQYDGAGGVWIDWNNDGDFLDANETIGTALVAVSTGNVIQNFTINVPLGQPIGNYRMRIVQTESATLAMLNPCGTFAYGSTEDYTVQVVNACVPTHTVTTFTPTSGPVGTEVTINGTGLIGTTVTFSGINATIVSNTGTQMVVVIPAGATTGMMSVKDSQPCTVDTIYTIITNNNTSCEGAASTTDLIIYDIHDEKDFDGGFITLYNGTAATVNLVNYSLYRTSNYGDTNYINYANLTGSIAPGTLGILKVSVGSCGPASTNGTINGGFNQNDGIQLRDAAGVVIIDDVHTYIPGAGYYMVRNTGALSARTSYVAADWSTIPLGSGVCYPSAGLVLPSGTAVAPVVTTQPSYSPSCGSTSAVLNTAGTEGFAGGNTLAYQWYFAAPGSATWTTVTDGGIYSGATTASLSISNTTTVINYQYYCQIRENTATCYSATNAIKITDTNASTWNGTTWIGGTPTLTKAAIINGTYVTATNGNFSCCSLTVNATKTLTISSGGYVEVQNSITTNGTLDVLSDGSLVQISDAGVNTGNIRYNRTANIRRQDYVYWSSPVVGFANSAVSPGTNLGYQYKWLPTTAGLNNFGNWAFANETMVLGKGYCLRGPDSFSLSALTNYTATFIGVPNNGVVTIPISRGSYDGVNYNTMVSTTPGTKDDDNWNLVGNPYPSAIDAIDFLTLNTNIAGFVNIWTHGALPSNAVGDPFYNNYAYNYTPTDYLTFNAVGPSTGPGSGSFNGRIAGGQGFFVSMLHASSATTENLIFNNSLRNITHNNNQFYKSVANNRNANNLEKHRMWFDIVAPNGASVRSLLGYVEDATNGKDRLFDAFSNEKLSLNIFSLIENEQMLIQGRTLPFNDNDKVNIGVSVPQEGLYKIALSSVDGLFSNANQNIYLEDKLLNVIYDLKSAPYSFMANKGTIKDRFIIRYNNGVVLANDTFDANVDVVVVSNQELSVVSTKEKIADLVVYDVLGRKLFEGKDIKTNNFVLPVHQRNAPLFIDIVLENGIKINKKTIY
ncbi:GEVED domain-containing protein [Flavobacterium facile]|uniref:GEVED domain-containing protein n=1 Tax=Flavobacterium facile TaxID=2893174 RepID=UPI002E75CE73|nr:GEVED domain-containing protein [Flavobacterium sp. T-12]